MSSRDVDAAAEVLDAADNALVRKQLWGAVTESDEYAAVATVFAAIDAGMTPEDVLLDVIAPVQQKIGAEWAANRLTVAQEHAATAINDRVIAALAHHPVSRTLADVGTVTVACVDGEWHALPARLLSEVLRLRGWQVDFLGAQVPTPHLVGHLHQTRPDAVALSCSIPTRLPTAHAAITACQAAGVAVLVGGAAFGPDGRYARQLGADAWAPDARTAAELLAKGFSRTNLSPSRQPIDDLPHLIDQEYTTVSQTSMRLVKETMASLEARIPAMRDYTELQRQRTAEDIASIVDFLVAGLYVDDDMLFSGFITWTADILTARGVPAATLFPALDILGRQLHEFPRSQRLLTAENSPSPVKRVRRPTPIEYMNFSMTITATPRSTCMRITGDLDYESIDELVAAASQVLAEQHDLVDLRLDFSGLTFLDSAALSGLLLIHRRTSHSGVNLHLDDRPPFLDRVLQVTGLFGHFVASDSDFAAGDTNLLRQAASSESSAR